jgi:hypothetical protein
LRYIRYILLSRDWEADMATTSWLYTATADFTLRDFVITVRDTSGCDSERIVHATSSMDALHQVHQAWMDAGFRPVAIREAV